MLYRLSGERNSSNGDLSLAYVDQPVSLLAPRRPSIFPWISCWKVLHQQTEPTPVLEIPQAKTPLRKNQSYSLPAKLSREWQTEEATPRKGLVCNLMRKSGCPGFTTCPAPSSQPILTSLLPPVLVLTALSEVLFAGHICQCSPAFWTTPDVQC